MKPEKAFKAYGVSRTTYKKLFLNFLYCSDLSNHQKEYPLFKDSVHIFGHLWWVSNLKHEWDKKQKDFDSLTVKMSGNLADQTPFIE